MEVPLPEFQSRLNFSDPDELAKELEDNQNGSYSQKLAEFIHSETQILRGRFIPDYVRELENVDAYEQAWVASTDLIKRSMELLWYTRFELEDIERGALELEKMEAELELKFCDFKREIYSYRERTLYLSSFILTSQKIMDMHRLLREMALKIYPLVRRDFSVFKRKLKFLKCAKMLDLSQEHDERISRRLRWWILMRQMDMMVTNAGHEHRASVRVVRDILPMGNFISQWDKWLDEEAMKLLETVINPDLKQKHGQEMVDLLQDIYVEMILPMTLPREFGLVFHHPNVGKVPLDMLC